MSYLNELQMRTAECQSSCIYHAFYMIIEFYLVWLQLCSILTDIGSRLQDLIISATDLAVSEILLFRKVSENFISLDKCF